MAEHPLIGTAFPDLWLRVPFSIILGLSNVLLLVPSTQEGGGGYSVSQAQHGSPRLDQTLGLYLDSLSLKN